MSDNNWRRLANRLEKCGYDHRHDGCVQVRIELVVVNGELRGWSRPAVQEFEPYSQRDEIATALLANENDGIELLAE